MNFEHVANHLRTSTATLAVADIVMVTGNGDFSGDGAIHQCGGTIEMEMVVRGEHGIPQVSGIFASEQYWTIGGVIEGGIPFWAVGLPSRTSCESSKITTTHSARFKLDRLNFLQSRVSAGALRNAMLSARTAGVDTSPAVIGDKAIMRLASYKLVWRDLYTTEERGTTTRICRDTLAGTLGDYSYSLVQKGEDCEVHLRKDSNAEGTMFSIQQVATALLTAIAFVHGRHAWPQWQQTKHDSGAGPGYVTPPQNVPQTIHTILTETTCGSGSSPTSLITKAAECFLVTGKFGEQLGSYLFLAREAAATQTPFQAGTLGLCAVLEGLVGLLHSHFCPAEPLDEAFTAARAELVRYANELAVRAEAEKASPESWRRLVGVMNGANARRPEDRFQQVTQHFGLPWEKMSPALLAWKKYRHRLAHGKTPTGSVADDFIVPSRVAGAINILAAAAVGYSGLAVLSRVEEEYINIPASQPPAQSS